MNEDNVPCPVCFRTYECASDCEEQAESMMIEDTIVRLQTAVKKLLLEVGYPVYEEISKEIDGSSAGRRVVGIEPADPKEYDLLSHDLDPIAHPKPFRGEWPMPNVTLTYGAITPYRYCLYVKGSPQERFIYPEQALEAFEKAVKENKYDESIFGL